MSTRDAVAHLRTLAVIGLSTLLIATAGHLTSAAAWLPTSHFVEVEPDVKLEVLDWQGRGQPVVLLAGYGRTAHDFDVFGATLAANGYRPYAITRRGFGLSSKPADGYSADRLGDDVLAVMDKLGLREPVLAAHSLGGEELSSIGSRFPERVAALVYLDAAYGYAFYDEQEQEDRERIDRNEVRRGIAQLTRAAEDGNAENVHRLLGRLLDTDLPALTQTLRAMQQRVPPTSANPRRGFSMRLRPGVDQMVFDGLQRYTKVSAPVLAFFALKGLQDPIALNEWRTGQRHEIAALKKAAPQARYVVLQDASHDVFRSHEADVLREMASFLNRLPNRGHAFEADGAISREEDMPRFEPGLEQRLAALRVDARGNDQCVRPKESVRNP